MPAVFFIPCNAMTVLVYIMNDEITKATSDHKIIQCREFVESIDHRMIAPSGGRPTKVNPSIRQRMRLRVTEYHIHWKTQNLTQADSQQFQLSVHHFYGGQGLFIEEDCQVSKDVKRMSLEEVESFTSAIKSCRNSRSDSFSIFHLKNLGPLARSYNTIQRLP